MPNRILKESICVSESVEELNWFEEVLFYRLIVNCDDYGLFDGRAAVIKGRLFPLKSVTHKQIEDAVNHLATVGIVRPYFHDGKPYLQLVTWHKHQQIRAQKSKYPMPEKDDFDINCNQLKSSDIKCSRNPIQSESNPNPNTNTKSACEERFEELWSLYPNKKGKGQVSKAQKEKLFKVPLEEMKRAISRYSAGLKRDSWRKAQNGSTFFNTGYVDYLDANYQETADEKSSSKYDFSALQNAAFKKMIGG